MKQLIAILFLASSSSFAQQASTPVGKLCSEMTVDSTRIERARCVQDDKCANLSKDATRVERARCEKKKK